MCLWNTKEKFGLSIRFFHWSIFLLVVTQFYLVYRRSYFTDAMPEKLQYILLHKSIGVLVLTLAFLMIVARHIGTRPPFPAHMSSLEKKAAKIMHASLYASLLLMPISGYLMSTFSGYAVSFFGYFKLPMLVEANKAYAQLARDFHEVLSFILIALVASHAVAAFYHHFVKKDNVLKRMAF